MAEARRRPAQQEPPLASAPCPSAIKQPGALNVSLDLRGRAMVATGRKGTEVIAIMEREVISITEQDVLLFGPIT